MAERFNPAEKSVAESDYEKKFNRIHGEESKAANSLKSEEAAPDASWKTDTKKKVDTPKGESKGRFRFLGRRAGKLRSGSAFLFVIGMIGLGVVYTSAFAPNIILVNIKEMYSNDLSDSTVALMNYYWKMMNYKIGRAQCDGSASNLGENSGVGSSGGGVDTSGKGGSTDRNTQGSIKCKLTTMSRAQKKAFEKAGFTVLGSKVFEDDRDLSNGMDNGDQDESRYKVTAILPPNYTKTIKAVKSDAQSLLNRIASGDLSGLGNALNNSMKDIIDSASLPKDAQSLLQYAPIASGDMLWLYAQISLKTKAQVYSVFDPITSFYEDKRFSSRLKSKYDLDKKLAVSGSTEDDVNKSFDDAMTGSNEGIDSTSAGPVSDGGIGLGSLSGMGSFMNMVHDANLDGTVSDILNGKVTSLPSDAVNALSAVMNAFSGKIPDLDALQKDPQGTIMKMLSSKDTPIPGSSIIPYETAMQLLITPVTSYPGLQCDWYAFGKAVTNDAQLAKAHTIARFAYQYLAAADKIKSGSTGEGAVINTLSSKLTQATFGGYNGPNATDSTEYKMIVYENLPIPSPFGFLYYLDTFDLIAAMAPAWGEIMASAAAVGQAAGIQGQLSMPPANLGGGDRDYCLGGESITSHADIKKDHCQEAIPASAPPGFQGLTADAEEVGWDTCSEPHQDERNPNQTHGEWLTQPSLRPTAEQLSPVVAGLFGANAAIWAGVMYNFFTSNTMGLAASDAIFAGTGEILGDMAMSRGMMPSNAAFMSLYLAQKPAIMNDYAQVARYNARNTPFDIYNKYSFLGSIVHSLSLSYDNKTPLFSSLTNIMSLFGSSMKMLGSTANATLYLQPDPFNPARLSCPDPAYLAIGIMADMACNVRYSFGPQELLAQPGSVLDYMLKEHSDLTQKNIDELTERLAQADEEGDQANVARMLASAKAAQNKPQIDEVTGKAIPGSEYEKFLNYCVNRVAPWGRSDLVVVSIKDNNTGQKIKVPVPAVSEGASADQDWYSGKKCTEQSEELTNFRAYTMMCSVDGTLGGASDCTGDDNSKVNYSDYFYTSNNILYLNPG